MAVKASIKGQVYNANLGELVFCTFADLGHREPNKSQGRDEALIERGTVGMSFRVQRGDCLWWRDCQWDFCEALGHHYSV